MDRSSNTARKGSNFKNQNMIFGIFHTLWWTQIKWQMNGWVSLHQGSCAFRWPSLVLCVLCIMTSMSKETTVLYLNSVWPHLPPLAVLTVGWKLSSALIFYKWSFGLSLHQSHYSLPCPVRISAVIQPKYSLYSKILSVSHLLLLKLMIMLLYLVPLFCQQIYIAIKCGSAIRWFI